MNSVDLSSVPEVSIDEVQLIACHAPSPQPETPQAEAAATLKYKEVWQRAFNKIKGKNQLSRLGKDMQLYGVSTVAKDDSGNEATGEFIQTLLNKTVIVANKKEQLRGLFSPDSKVLEIWSAISFLLMLYSAFVTPFYIAFHDSSPSNALFYVDFSVNILFACDIVITLNTAVEANGALDTSRFRIFLKYLKSWLLLDIVACIPFASFDQDNPTASSNLDHFAYFPRLLRLPRLYRLLRLTRVLKLLNSRHSWKCLDSFHEKLGVRHSVTRILFFLNNVLLAVHLMACIWFFFADLQGLSPLTWVGQLNLQHDAPFDQYIASIYWTVTTLSTVGYGDIVPGTSLERIVSIFWMIFSLYFFSFTVSALSTVLNSVDTKESLLSHKLAAIEEFALESQLAKDLHDRLRLALKYSTMKSGFSTEVKFKIFTDLPRELRCEVALAMHHGVARHIPFFRDRDQAFLSAVVPLLSTVEILDHCPVYKAGEYADEIYFLAKGKCLHMYGELVMKKLGEGSYFGEIEVLFNIPRKNAVLAAGTSDLLSMNKNVVRLIEEDFPPVYEEMRQIAEIRSQANERMNEKYRNLFGVKSTATSPPTAGTPSLLVTQPQDSELPILNAKEAWKQSEDQLTALEVSVTTLKAQVDIMMQLLVQKG